MSRNSKSAYLFVAPAVLLFAFTILAPIVMTFAFSFYDWNGFGTMTFVGLDNYARAIKDHIYLESYWHKCSSDLAWPD
jgi:raffinose/stachyose/melibiose transport system permease protein